LFIGGHPDIGKDDYNIIQNFTVGGKNWALPEKFFSSLGKGDGDFSNPHGLSINFVDSQEEKTSGDTKSDNYAICKEFM
jgi:hypothetical protein